MKQVTATEAARRFSEVLDAVEHARETFLITRGGRVVASIAPAPAGNGEAVKELLRSYRPDPELARELRETLDLLGDRKLPWPD